MPRLQPCEAQGALASGGHTNAVPEADPILGPPKAQDSAKTKPDNRSLRRAALRAPLPLR